MLAIPENNNRTFLPVSNIQKFPVSQGENKAFLSMSFCGPFTAYHPATLVSTPCGPFPGLW